MNQTTRRPAERRKPLPPLDYLLAFEAAAEHESFAAAARQINISETAISRKVRLLEQHFGLQLFARGHRSIELTPYGREFLARISPAIEMLREAADDALKTSKNRPVILAATQSVASLWLTPRLHEFRQANRHLSIMLVASDNDTECLADTVDLAILRGDGSWKGFDAQLVFGETIFPVCSPEFLAQNPEVAEIENLAGAPLIEVTSSHTEWMNWQAWLARMGAEARRLERTTLFNSYPLSIHAALDGVGVALGWGHLVDQYLNNGRLVRPLGDAQVRTKFGYYLLTPQNHPAFPSRTEISDWLMAVSASRKRYGQ
ncbi:LysR substrate-binding domain-containing protein [Albidovulum sediminicola]|uniref:LysR substrate-binding domain-containing protein n=1 Tax=Albidovulum sediminicola TaxID=2984331 RepID=A0ABT2Z6H0_9RHOB|nr:LysR substrate-binding domain-containing protein [Defluviimonas sp. WL0075]MCV2866742.1 LysR substrate-binding domain-containing protein [Defluviimonas sp. WL0075]